MASTLERGVFVVSISEIVNDADYGDSNDGSEKEAPLLPRNPAENSVLNADS